MKTNLILFKYSNSLLYKNIFSQFHRTNTKHVKNYYSNLTLTLEILEVGNKATEAQIKQAYLKMAKVYHPDLNKAPGSKEKFADILEAYDVLSEENKRLAYDKSGLNASQLEDIEYEKTLNKLQPGTYENPVEYSSDEEGDFQKIEDILDIKPYYERLDKFYGEHSEIDSNYDILFDLNITFSEYINGSIRQIIYKKNLLCPNCKGELCLYIIFNFSICSYNGFRSQDVVENVVIPKAVKFKEHFIIKLTEKGNDYKKDNKINTSNLYVRVTVAEHEYFKLKGSNIYTENYISISQYVLGGKIKIATIKGNKEIIINPYCKSLVLKSYGIDDKSDQIVNLNIRLPKNLNREQFKIFGELKQLNL